MSLNTNAIRFKTASEIVIASGVANPTGGFHTVASESGAADDLDTLAITAYQDLSVASTSYLPLLILQAATGATITVKHNTGNIKLAGDADVTITADEKILLFWDGTQWTDFK